MLSIDATFEEQFHDMLTKEIQRQADPLVEKVAKYLHQHTSEATYEECLHAAVFLRAQLQFPLADKAEEAEVLKFGQCWYKAERFEQVLLLKRYMPEELCQDYLEFDSKEFPTA